MVDMRMGFRGVSRLFLRRNLTLNPIVVISLPGTLSNRERATCPSYLTHFVSCLIWSASLKDKIIEVRDGYVCMTVFLATWALQTELAAESPGAGPVVASPRVRRLRFVWTKLSFAKESLGRSTAAFYRLGACLLQFCFLHPQDCLYLLEIHTTQGLY